MKIDICSFRESYMKIKRDYFNEGSAVIREKLAEANNCIAIGKSSCYADLVAVPKNYSDIVIKICSGTDRFIDYANFCHFGELTGEHFLKVYSSTEIAKNVWLFTMERLERELTQREYDLTVNRSQSWYSYNIPTRGKYARICKSLKQTLNDLDQFFDYKLGDRYYGFDLHRNNVMWRKDGSLVLLDPI